MATEDWLRPSIHPTYARILCVWLRQQGFDTATILQGTQLSWEQLLLDQRFISLAQMARLIRRGVALTRQPWLGLSVGMATQASYHGPVGYAAMTAPDIRTMLQVITRYAPLRMQLLEYRYEEQADVCVMSALERVDMRDCREYVLAANATVLFLLVLATTGEPLRQARVCFPFAAPEWVSRYKEVFGGELVFGADYYHVVLPRAFLDTPMITTDRQAHQQSLRDCERLLRDYEAGGAWTQRVRHRLLDCAGRFPNLEHMAGEFAMSRRTLIRHLKQEGSAYQELLDDVRKEMAMWYLLQTQLPVEQVAEQLGYTDTSNFSRTFRRWFGMTPRDMRQREGNGASVAHL